MRNHPLKFTFFIFLMSLAPPALRGPVAPNLQAALADLDSSLASDFASDGIGGMSVGVVSGGSLIWSKHYGYAEAETARVATNDTAYRIGSITKQFTGLALLQLVENGKMRLTDPVRNYVPEVWFVKNGYGGALRITLLQVATMYSGLAREPGCGPQSVGPVSVWQREVVTCLPTAHYANKPGTTYLYSNFGYAVLGLAIERAARQPFTFVVADRILKPLGMGRSGWQASTDLRTDLARGYQRAPSGTVTRTRADRDLEGMGYRVPSGGLFSTVNDLTKFIAWELGEGPLLIRKDTQDANYARVFSPGYGVGFGITRVGDIVMIGHNGSTAGYQSNALVHRPTGLGVIILRNCDSCAVGASPVAVRWLERLVRASQAEPSPAK